MFWSRLMGCSYWLVLLYCFLGRHHGNTKEGRATAQEEPRTLDRHEISPDLSHSFGQWHEKKPLGMGAEGICACSCGYTNRYVLTEDRIVPHQICIGQRLTLGVLLNCFSHFFEAGSLIEPRVYWVSLDGWPRSFRDRSILAPICPRNILMLLKIYLLW